LRAKVVPAGTAGAIALSPLPDGTIPYGIPVLQNSQPGTQGNQSLTITIRGTTVQISRNYVPQNAPGMINTAQMTAQYDGANTISGELINSLGRQTATHDQQLQIASELFATQRAALKTLVESDVPAIERELERLGAPYTPGRVPR
jgi:hypothetical protein